MMIHFAHSRSMARAALPVVLLGLAAFSAAGAQITPPNIRKPIETAKKAAATTSEQIRTAEKVGGAGKVDDGMMPAEAAKGAQAAATSTANPQKAAVAPAQKAATAPQRGGSRGDSGSVTQAGRGRAVATVYREVFAYGAGDRRDPFVSLMLSGELRPIFTDLVLTGVIYDPGGGSVALLVDNSTGESYRVRVRQTLGRMKVTKIGLEEITFDLDEFGLSRSETLIIDKTKKAGAPATRRP